VVGWGVFAFLSYKVATTRSDNKVYDPFEILGIGHGTPEKQIQSHYKKLSLKFHPDKVKLAVNQTLEEANEYFVQITKAYKSLTDPEIRKNWELYGHPDGRQEVSMGIAIPKWVVEGQNKFWVLLVYCAVIGGLLPVIVGRWWFGKKIKTKDGVYTKTADVFFKGLKEDASMEDMVKKIAEVLEWEAPNVPGSPDLETKVKARLGESYRGCNAATLLYAHLYRIPVADATLRKGMVYCPASLFLGVDHSVAAQEEVLLRIPALLLSLLNIVLSRNWLQTTITAMRLNAFLTQALPPSQTVTDELKVAQLPGCSTEDARSLVDQTGEVTIPSLVDKLQHRSDPRFDDVKKAAEKWGKFDLVEASFKGTFLERDIPL
jgi:translocation protein SEC63